ncbi:MAG: hypothetical protein IJS30_06990, partial [Bacteroidales bacterium]|nr:hypothetical protein [Bacteroidales bacterium]
SSNALTTVGNNLISHNDLDYGLSTAVLNGALWGGLSGAISGGIRGYQYAKEHGASPWSNKINGMEQKYGRLVKKGIHTQDDYSEYCYANVAEYADAGHGNHLTEEFINASNGAKGGDVSVLKEVSNDVKRMQSLLTIGADDWSTFAPNLSSEAIEVAGTIRGGSHWVNVIGAKSYRSLNWFSGGQTDVKLLRIWNPAGGTISYINLHSVSHFRLFYYR